MKASPISHNPSPPVTHLSQIKFSRFTKRSNPGPSVTKAGDGLVTHFREGKDSKYKENSLFHMYMSPCHACTRAMRVRTHEGCMTDHGDALLHERLGTPRRFRLQPGHPEQPPY